MNNAIFFSLYSLAHQSKLFDNFVFFCAEYLIYIGVILAIFFIIYHNWKFLKEDNIFFIIRKFFKEFIMVFVPACFAWVVTDILKNIFASPRPFIKFADIVTPLFTHGGMDSFPSGHATFFGALALSLFFVNKKVGYLFILFAILIGLARIISGVHFPVDILCGYILGIIIVLIFHYFTKKNK